jgi:hypothetical protein
MPAAMVILAEWELQSSFELDDGDGAQNRRR